MKIIGLGVDIVSLERIEAIWLRHGERFGRRILAPGEYDELLACAGPVAFLAKRFAAKEALAKALGTGISAGVSLHEIQVTHDPRGRPEILLHGATRGVADGLGVSEIHLSLADERRYAVAQVVIVG